MAEKIQKLKAPMTTSRKQFASSRCVVAPPTETTRMLELLLDRKNNDKKKRSTHRDNPSRKENRRSTISTVAKQSQSARWSQLTSSQGNFGRIVLGKSETLANAPTYRKKPLIVRPENIPNRKKNSSKQEKKRTNSEIIVHEKSDRPILQSAHSEPQSKISNINILEIGTEDSGASTLARSKPKSKKPRMDASETGTAAPRANKALGMTLGVNAVKSSRYPEANIKQKTPYFSKLMLSELGSGKPTIDAPAPKKGASERLILGLNLSKSTFNLKRERPLTSEVQFAHSTSTKDAKRLQIPSQSNQNKFTSGLQDAKAVKPVINNPLKTIHDNSLAVQLKSTGAAVTQARKAEQGNSSQENKSQEQRNASYNLKRRVENSNIPCLNLENSKEQIIVSQQKKRRVDNSNFVRLNLKNNAGSCRGARNKRAKKNPWILQKQGSNQNSRSQDTESMEPKQDSVEDTKKIKVSQSGVDPLDDYLDGTLHSKPKNTRYRKASNDVPCCSRHQMPCKLLTVKKTSTGNKGRKFYACAMPRGEQCDHFEWADDNIEVVRTALQKNSSYSGFVARQVFAYMERFRKLTVPELRHIAKNRKLDSSGRKQQILVRLSIWVRDELVDNSPEPVDTNAVDSHQGEEIGDEDCDECSSNDDSSYLSEELELCDVASDDIDENVSNIHTSKDETTKTYDIPLDETNEQIDTKNNKKGKKHHGGGRNENLKETSDTGSPSSCPIQLALTSLFGYQQFRVGQKWAIQRCMNNLNTLLVAPTGFGKSLCYAIPASIKDGVCIVVSPLISLIQDQLRELPPRVPATTLSGSISNSAMASIIDDIVRNRIKILFVSPERLASSSFKRLFQPKWNEDTKQRERPFPTVSLLCVDEAHCLSQWGHNFRPSYLRLRSLLQLIQPQSVLAITATAGEQVIGDICGTLNIPRSTDDACAGIEKNESGRSQSGLWTMKSDRDNIDVSCFIVANQEQRLSMLSKLLKPYRSQQARKDSNEEKNDFEGCLSTGSVIVYTWRQKDAEVVAENIQASGVDGGVVVYHGGMDTVARSNAQSKFMRGKARICVATVAFGLGVNKADVCGVVHMYLPASPENYLQEIGRAGRDGRPAKAVAMVLQDEVLIRHSQSHSDAVSRSQVKSILFSVRNTLSSALDLLRSDKDSRNSQPPIEGPVSVALPLHATAIESDCKPETVETILSILEQSSTDDGAVIQIEGISYDQATVALKRRTIAKLASKENVMRCIMECGKCIDPPVGEAAATNAEQDLATQLDENNEVVSGPKHNFYVQKQFLAYSFGSYTFSVTKCASLLGPLAQPRHVFAALRRLQDEGEIELALNTSATGRFLRIHVNDKGLQLFRRDDLQDRNNLSDIDDVAGKLTKQFSSTVTSAATRVLDINYIIHQVSDIRQITTASERKGNSIVDKSPSLTLFQDLVKTYFEAEGTGTTFNKDSGASGFSSNISKKELQNDTSRALSDLLLEKHHSSDFSLKISDSDAYDYAALAITKFFHGIGTTRAPLHSIRGHYLFSKWQTVQFSTLQNKVEEILTSHYSN